MDDTIEVTPEMYMDDTMGVTPEMYMDDVMAEMPEPELYADIEDFDYYMETGSMDSMPAGEMDGAMAMMGLGIVIVWFVFVFAMVALMIASLWKIFTKAGEDGWKAIIPIYNTIVLLDIAGKPWWWLLLLFIPFVNIVVAIMMWHAVCKSFGKGVGYLLGILFLGIIFVPMLAFGSSEYIGPDGEGNSDDNNAVPQDPKPAQPTQQMPSQDVDLDM